MLVLLLSSFSTLDLPRSMAQSDGRSSWVSILIISLIYAVSASMIAKMNKAHEGEVFFDYGKELAGKFTITVVTLYYLVYYYMIAIYLDTKMVHFLQANFLPKTPCMVMLLFGILLYSYAITKRLTIIARLAELIGIAFLIMIVAISIAMLSTGMVYNILPLINLKEISGKAFKDLIIPFGGIELLLVLPFWKENKKVVKTVFFTLLFIGFLYVLVVQSTILTLGINNTMTLNDSFIEALRAVEIPMIERLDIYYLTFNLSALFMEMILLYTMIIEFASKLLPKAKRGVLCIYIGAISFTLCFIKSKLENVDQFFLKALPVLAILSSFIIPFVFYIADRMAQSKQKEKG